MSRRSRTSSRFLAVTVPVIIAILGVVGIYVQYVLPTKVSLSATQTAQANFSIAALSALSATLAPSATNILTATLTSSPSPTPCPTGVLCEVFPNIPDGQVFEWSTPPGSLKTRFTTECAHSSSVGLQLDYSFAGIKDNGGWGTHWALPPARHLNAAEEGFTIISFWIMGKNGEEKFLIGLKDTGDIDKQGDEKEVKVNSERYVFVVKSVWKLVEIRLDHFADNQGAVNLASLENLSFSLDRSHGTGSLCIDDIAFR